MKKLSTFLLLFCCGLFSAQVALRTNLLHTIPLNKSLTFELRINKGDLSNFSRLQVDVPSGIRIEEVESREGTFSFEDQKAKIIWVVSPKESEFSVRMKIKAVKTAQKVPIIFKYYYVVNDEKKELEALPYLVHYKDTVLPVFMSAPMENLLVKGAPAPVAAAVVPKEVNTKDAEQLKQQVSQLKKDSEDAYAVGEREKKAAEEKLALILEEEKQLEAIEDEDEKILRTEKVMEDKKQAEDELAIAERVLTLAKSLDSNAGEIERINKQVNPESFEEKSNEQTNPIVPVATNENNSTSLPETPPIKKEVPVTTEPVAAKKEKAVEPVKNKTWGDIAQFAKESETPTMGNRVFHVQVGAFKEKPDLAQFKTMGKVKVVNENDAFKVLVGNYASREEANKKKMELVSKGVDSFVVAYEDGQRVK